MLNTLITGKTRIKLLLKFFLNSNTTSYLRDLESDFGDSTNAIRLELNRFEQAGLLNSQVKGNKKVFKANTGHPLFHELQSIIMKTIGFDQIVERFIRRLGGLERAYVTGSFAKGNDSRIIDLMLVGTEIDREYLLRKVDQVEELIHRKVRYLIVNPEEATAYLQEHEEALLLYQVAGEVTSNA